MEVVSMVCKHKSCGEKAWLPYEYQGRLRGLRAHPVCTECGQVKNISSDRPKSIGHFINILTHLEQAYSLSRVQIRLISREMVCLEDAYGFCRHQQEKAFAGIVKKYTRIPEWSIKSAL
jgi:hypothetical protein